MEGKNTYRWERRRKKFTTLNQARAFRSFWAFELILLVLIFAVWLIGARIIQVYAVTQLPCAEAIAAFGASENLPPIFDFFFWISVLLAGLWATISLSFWRILRTSKSVLFHLFLLLCIGLLIVNFRMMHLDDNRPPDGSLGIRPMIVDMSGDIPTHHEVVPMFGPDYEMWSLGKPSPADDLYYNAVSQYCVWLDQNVIFDNANFRIDGYGTASLDGKRNMLRKAYGGFYGWSVDIKPMSANEQTRALWTWGISGDSGLETLRSHHKYRPLTQEERQRFLEKQACLKENVFNPRQYKNCQWYVVYYPDGRLSQVTE